MSHDLARSCAARLGNAAGSQGEGNVLEHRHVRKEEVLLEHHPAGAPLRRHEHARRRIVDNFAEHLDRAPFDRQETGEAAQDRRLPGTVGPQQRHHLACFGVEPHVEVQRPACDRNTGTQRHVVSSPPPSHLSRSATRTPKDTATINSAMHDGLRLVDVESLVDRQRQCLGLAREASGEGDRGAELTEGPRPRQHRSGDQCGANSGQRHTTERVPIARPECSRRVVVSGVGLADCRLDRDDEERHGDERLGDHHPRRCERQPHVEPAIEPLTQQPPPTEGVQQGDAADDRRQHHRQGAERTHHRATEEPATGQQPRQRQPQQHRQRRCAQAADDRQPQRLPHRIACAGSTMHRSTAPG